MATSVKHWRFTTDEYHKMAEVGLLGEDDRVELIEGEVLEMAPIRSQHSGHVNRIDAWFQKNLGERVVVASQNPVRLSMHSEPQSDLAVLRARPDFYTSSHPGPDDVLLLIEVADSSVAYDREVKVPLYAASGIPEVWLVDLEAQAVETYRTPGPAGYATQRVEKAGGTLTPSAFRDLTVPVNDILGV